MKSTISLFLLSLCAASLTDLSGTESVVDSLTDMVGTSNPLKSELDQIDDIEAPLKEAEGDFLNETETVIIKEVELEAPNTSNLKVKPEKKSYGEESDYSTGDESSSEDFNGDHYNNKGSIKHHRGKMSYYGSQSGHHKGRHYKKGHNSDSDSSSESESEGEGVYHRGRSGFNKKGRYNAPRLYKRSDWNKKSYYGDDLSDEQHSSDEEMHKGHKAGFGGSKNHCGGFMSYSPEKSGYGGSKDNWTGHMGEKVGYGFDHGHWRGHAGHGKDNDYWGGYKGHGGKMDGYGDSKGPWKGHMDGFRSDDGHMGHKKGYGEDNDHWDGHKGYGGDMAGYGNKKLYRRNYYNNSPWDSAPRNYRRSYYDGPQNMGFRNYRRNYYNSRDNFVPNYNY